MKGLNISSMEETSLSELKEELRSALTFAYVIKKLRKAGIFPKDDTDDCLYFVNRDIRYCIHQLAELKNEKGVEDEIFGVGFVSQNPSSETEAIFTKVWNEVVKDIDQKWNTA